MIISGGAKREDGWRQEGREKTRKKGRVKKEQGRGSGKKERGSEQRMGMREERKSDK